MKKNVWRIASTFLPAIILSIAVFGYLSREKSKIVGRSFVFADKVLYNKSDLTTGRQITPVTGDVWKCVDIVVLSDSLQPLNIIIQNSQGENVAFPYDEAVHPQNPGIVYTALEAKENEEKLGKENFMRQLKENKISAQ